MAIAHVIGLGKSGLAAATLLQYQGWHVIIRDGGYSPALIHQKTSLADRGIVVQLGDPLAYPIVAPTDMPQLIVVSPGVPWDHPGLLQARNHGIETIGEMELAWRNLQSHQWIGITGTNGKTTTTALIAAIFQSAGLHAPACGNIGKAACEIARQIQDPSTSDATRTIDWIIAEISSFQIESSSTLAPRIGIWTTLTPDHLDRHKTLENYAAIKSQLLHQASDQILNGDDPWLHHHGFQQWSGAWWTSTHGQSALLGDVKRGCYIQAGWVVIAGQPILPVNSLKMGGVHNQQNLLMAVMAAHIAGISAKVIAKAISDFPGVPHRLELICTWQGVDFINDSKATNYDAAEVGLAAVSAPVILIAGGKAKSGDDHQWLATIQAKAAAVLLIGDAAPLFARRLQQVNYQTYEVVETMAAAVPRSMDLALKYGAKVVLLSPACASFDHYANFEQRGDDFRTLCQNRWGNPRGFVVD